MSIISRSYEPALKFFKANIGSLTVSTCSNPHTIDWLKREDIEDELLTQLELTLQIKVQSFVDYFQS